MNRHCESRNIQYLAQHVIWQTPQYYKPQWGAFKQTTPKSHRIYLQLAFDLWHVQQKGIPNVKPLRRTSVSTPVSI